MDNTERIIIYAENCIEIGFCGNVRQVSKDVTINLDLLQLQAECGEKLRFSASLTYVCSS